MSILHHFLFNIFKSLIVQCSLNLANLLISKLCKLFNLWLFHLSGSLLFDIVCRLDLGRDQRLCLLILLLLLLETDASYHLRLLFDRRKLLHLVSLHVFWHSRLGWLFIYLSTVSLSLWIRNEIILSIINNVNHRFDILNRFSSVFSLLLTFFFFILVWRPSDVHEIIVLCTWLR